MKSVTNNKYHAKIYQFRTMLNFNFLAVILKYVALQSRRPKKFVLEIFNKLVCEIYVSHYIYATPPPTCM
jgi:hypothetical protein